MHKGLFLCKSTLCKAGALLWDFDLLILSTPPLIWYLSCPLSTLTSLPFLRLEISLQQSNSQSCRTPGWNLASQTRILLWLPFFLFTATKNSSRQPQSHRELPLELHHLWLVHFPRDTGPMEGASHKSPAQDQEPKLKLETDVTFCSTKNQGSHYGKSKWEQRYYKLLLKCQDTEYLYYQDSQKQLYIELYIFHGLLSTKSQELHISTSSQQGRAWGGRQESQSWSPSGLRENQTLTSV